MKRTSILALIVLAATAMTGPVSAESSSEACTSCGQAVKLCEEIVATLPTMGTPCKDLKTRCEVALCMAKPGAETEVAMICIDMLAQCPKDQPKCSELSSACIKAISPDSQ